MFSTHLWKEPKDILHSLLRALQKILQRLRSTAWWLMCNKCPVCLWVLRSTQLYIHHQRSSGQKEAKLNTLLKFSQQWGSSNMVKYLHKNKVPEAIYCKEDPLLVQWKEAEKEVHNKQGACLLPILGIYIYVYIIFYMFCFLLLVYIVLGRS